MGRIIDEYKESRLNALGPSFKDRLNAIKNSPTDSHLANTLAREVTARIDDVARLTKFFASPQGIKFAAKQGAIFQVANQDEKGRERLKSSGVSVAKLIANTLKQTAISGTGNRFENPYLFPLYLGENNSLTEVDDRPDSLKNLLIGPSGSKTEENENRPTYSLYSKTVPKDTTSTGYSQILASKIEGDNKDLDERTKDVRYNLKEFRRSKQNSENLQKTSKEVAPDVIRTKLKPRRGAKNTRGTVDFNPDTEEDKLVTSAILNDPEYRDKDIIPFEFQVLNPSNPNTPKYVYFRAYLDSFSDSYTGNWNSTQYIGRAEPLYNYEAFGRTVDFSFKIAAETRKDLLPLYKKINYIAGTTAPSYDTDQTFMRGVITRVTIGDYLVQTPGFFTNISLSWNKTYAWETGIFKVSNTSLAAYNEYIAEDNIPKVPHILDVSMNFTPIHDFNPAIERPFITNQQFLDSTYNYPSPPPVVPTVPSPPPESQFIDEDLDALAFDLNNSTSNITPTYPPAPTSREEQELEQAFLNAGINF